MCLVVVVLVMLTMWRGKMSSWIVYMFDEEVPKTPPDDTRIVIAELIILAVIFIMGVILV